jgi:hypothetical protein
VLHIVVRRRLLALVLSIGCTDAEGSAEPSASGIDASSPHTDTAVTSDRLPLPAGCVEDWLEPPASLACTGLYSSVADKLVSPEVREFAPADQLWTDGAEKRRWIWLPPGTVVDTSNPNEWSFPVGTKTWKEFTRDGKRVETRLFHKVEQDAAERWIWASYRWRDDQTQADFTWGGVDVPTATGTPHYIPNSEECLTCHKGRADRLLGFEAALLGLPGAQGMSLTSLAAEGRLSSPPIRTAYTIPDDGTGLAPPVISWLHVNCGISCHNENPNSKAAVSAQFLRIDARQLDSLAPVTEWNVLKTTLNQKAITAYAGAVRIVPGAPERSLLLRLASSRGTVDQMPALGTRVVDPVPLRMVRDWILRLAPRLEPDAGISSSFDGGGPLAYPQDSGPPAVPPPDAGAPALELVDAAPVGLDAASPQQFDAEVTDTGP